MKHNVTIKNVCVGTIFFQPEYTYPHNALMEVVDIEYNKNAGQPVRDMFGGVVWEEPFASIKAKNTITGKIHGYAVQSEDSVLSEWLTFVDDVEEYKRLTKKETYEVTITTVITVPATATENDINREIKRNLEKGEYKISNGMRSM